MDWLLIGFLLLLIIGLFWLARMVRAQWAIYFLLLATAGISYWLWSVFPLGWQRTLLGLAALALGLSIVYFGREDLKRSFRAVFMKGVLRRSMRGVLERLLTSDQPFTQKPWKGKLGFTHEVQDLGNCKVEWVRPDGSKRKRVLYYLHGGAYVAGLYNLYRDHACRLSKALGGLDVLLLDYRLAPHYGHPSQLEDALAGFQYLLAQGYELDEIVLGGDSAGGNLCLVLPLKLRELGLPMPRSLIAISPLADMSGYSPSLYTKMKDDLILGPGLANMRKQSSRMIPPRFTTEDQVENPLISPVFADLSCFPPMLLQVGQDEMLLFETEMIYHRARQAGVAVRLEEFEGMFHVFHIHKMPESALALRQMRSFLDELPKPEDSSVTVF